MLEKPPKQLSGLSTRVLLPGGPPFLLIICVKLYDWIMGFDPVLMKYYGGVQWRMKKNSRFS
jgi:hypothetical protein